MTGHNMTSGYASYRSEAVCTAVTGSMTIALRAQRTLAAAAIRSEVVKVSSSKASRGCAYGVRYPRAVSGNVEAILKNAKISIKYYEN